MDAKIKKWCEKTGTRKNAIEFLINEYYMKNLRWTEEKATKHVIELFENGTIEQIKIFGKNGKEI